MIEEKFLISDKDGMSRATWYTNLSEEGVEVITGRFGKRSRRSGKLRGELVVYTTGEVVIRHDFTKKILWRS